MGRFTAEGKKRYGSVENMYYQQAKKAEDNSDKAVKAGIASLGAVTAACAAATALGAEAVASTLATPIGGAIFGSALLYAACNEGKAQLKLRKYAKLKNVPMRYYMTTRQPNAYVFDKDGGARDMFYY